MTKTSRPPAKPARPPARAAATRRKAPALAAKAAAPAAATPVPAQPRKAAKAAPIEPGKRDAAKASGKPSKPGKARIALVRDGFTMPAADFALVGLLKTRALGARREAKKSELLRAGLRALAELDAAALVAALNRLEPVKTGRPKKAH